MSGWDQLGVFSAQAWWFWATQAFSRGSCRGFLWSAWLLPLARFRLTWRYALLAGFPTILMQLRTCVGRRWRPGQGPSPCLISCEQPFDSMVKWSSLAAWSLSVCVTLCLQKHLMRLLSGWRSRHQSSVHLACMHFTSSNFKMATLLRIAYVKRYRFMSNWLISVQINLNIIRMTRFYSEQI